MQGILGGDCSKIAKTEMDGYIRGLAWSSTSQLFACSRSGSIHQLNVRSTESDLYLGCQ